MIWAPHLGLKGQIDVTARVRLRRPARPNTTHQLGQQHGAWGAEALVPLELKTGKFKNDVEHRAQLILYTLLLAERYGVDVPIGAERCFLFDIRLLV